MSLELRQSNAGSRDDRRLGQKIGRCLFLKPMIVSVTIEKNKGGLVDLNKHRLCFHVMHACLKIIRGR